MSADVPRVRLCSCLSVVKSTPSSNISELLSFRPASDPLLVFAAAKKMAPSLREAIGPEVPD